MSNRYLILEFNTEKVTIELLNTPVVERWRTAYLSHKEFLDKSDLPYKDFKIELARIFGHFTGKDIGKPGDSIEYSTGLNAQQIVDEINSAINDVEANVNGAPFPYRAFVGMSWEHTNSIHRCFTTAGNTACNWKHMLDTPTLTKFKKDVYESKLGLRDIIETKQFVVSKYDKFMDALFRINKFIHAYEGLHKSERVQTFTPFTDCQYLELNWDNFTLAGGHTFSYTERTSYEELKQSFPGDYSSYDVFLGKSISGKDYEDTFTQYDDPTEFDITNVDYIDGSVRIHNYPGISKYYSNSVFSSWCESYNIEPSMYLPVPLGRVVNTTFDLSLIKKDFSSDDKWSNGMVKCQYPFNSVNSYIIEE